MSKITPSTSITKSGVNSAVARARAGAGAGEQGEIKDGACKGLSLRMRGGTVSWTIRWKWNDTYKRWTIGGHEVLPDEARRRGWHVKSCCQQGIDPGPQIREWTTGISIYLQTELARAAPVKSVEWSAAKKIFLDHVFAKRSAATYDDYRNILDNTPELRRFEGKMVATITEYDVAGVYSDVFKRAEPHSEHVQRVVSSMWSTLAGADYRPRTGIVPNSIRHVKAPERSRQTIGEVNTGEESPPPDRMHIGRYLAIANVGVFPPRISAAMLLMAGSAQRIRAICGIHRANFQTFGDEELWKMPPYFRKPSKKKRSKGIHPVPLVGFAAEALRRLDRLAGDNPWLLPVERSRRKGQQPKHPFMPPRTLSRNIEVIPGVELSSHDFRAALATYGPQDLGWLATDSKLILDHLEGFDSNDVTAQHYNTNPEILKKREMMRQWVGWLEKQEAAAVAADPTLLDAEAVREQIYRIRYSDEAWTAKIEKARKLGIPIWQQPGRAKVPVEVEAAE